MMTQLTALREKIVAALRAAEDEELRLVRMAEDAKSARLVHAGMLKGFDAAAQAMGAEPALLPPEAVLETPVKDPASEVASG